MIAPRESSVAWMADVMLRAGGWIVVLDFQCAFDESGTHKQSTILCVAGYIMEKEQARELDREWNEVLNWDELEHPLPYFHMADCAIDPGYGVFSGISKPHRIQVASRMIAIIKRRTAIGIAVTISKPEFWAILGGSTIYPDPYVLAGHIVLQAVAKFINSRSSDVERMAYFFESGHESRSDLEALFTVALKWGYFQPQYRYAGHAFVPKIGNPNVQAADLLAWQWLKDRKNIAEGRPQRKDLASLLIHQHISMHANVEALKRLAEVKGPSQRLIYEILGVK